MKFLLTTVALLIALMMPTLAQAQTQDVTNPGATKLAWDHVADWDAVGVTGFKLYVDTVTIGLDLTATRVGDHYETPFPAITPGAHQLAVTVFNDAGESPRSNVLFVRLVVVPSGPTGLRIIAMATQDAEGNWVWESVA